MAFGTYFHHKLLAETAILRTHNSFACVGRVGVPNQSRSITEQLNDGIGNLLLPHKTCRDRHFEDAQLVCLRRLGRGAESKSEHYGATE